MTRSTSRDASARDAPTCVAVMGAGVPVGAEVLAALAPYETDIVSQESLERAPPTESAAVVIIAADQVRATGAVEASRRGSPDIPIVVVVPSLHGFDGAALASVGATDLVSFSDASACPLALVVDASRRVQALRTRLGAVERECRCRDDAFVAWASAEAKTRGALREGLSGVLAAVRALRYGPDVEPADPVVLASMAASLQRMQMMVDRREHEVPVPWRTHA